MTTFDDREKAFENKYAHDAEMQFKANARGMRLLGSWAADKMGLIGAEAEAYAKEVIKSDFEEAGHEDVYRKVMGDFTAKAVAVDEATLRNKMTEFLAAGKAQVMGEVDG